ncbi:cupin domain-containing protein [Bifidobacterium biavatii]|uniref:Cupin domain protein, PF06172 family n=1 Tax=Bifidobacterium biavatii DSM 23969 TaxID=1437608 RepID=A0A086ZL45_9BIFI|nr:cupin domain-containing protein [Bifidobacterium biavatii]KFI47245.1 cupin domain protein, PF06172 family [Bifidobacterium biavatii DSM 23969]
MSVALENMSAYARSVVERLGLEAHPEGGWYTRDWQAPAIDQASGRPLASLIYFLLPEGDASAWHKVDADEIWLWHGPSTVTLELGGSGDAPAADPAEIQSIMLGQGVAGTGPTAEADDSPAAASTASITSGTSAASAAPVGHAIVPAGVWQRTVPGRGDALVSCVVSPGFTFDGFTLE